VGEALLPLGEILVALIGLDNSSLSESLKYLLDDKHICRKDSHLITMAFL